MLIINFYNQQGAGPYKISSEFIDKILEKKTKDKIFIIMNSNKFKMYRPKKNLSIFYLKRISPKIFEYLIRSFIELLITIFCLIKKCNYLAFGSINLVFFSKINVTLVHHPYIYDDYILSRLSYPKKIKEKLIRIVFKIFTLRKNKILVVQSKLIQSLLKKKFNLKNKIKVIPNPISDIFFSKYKTMVAPSFKSHIMFYYISRYYDHKNHIFLFNFSKFLSKNNINHKIFITVTKSKDNRYFMSNLKNYSNIVNLGFIDSEKVFKVMANCHFCLYPSLSETFGNNLLETLYLNKPLIAFDKDFIKVFFRKDQFIEILDNKRMIDRNNLKLMKNFQAYNNFVKNLNYDKSNILDLSSWVKKYLGIFDLNL